MPKDKHSAHKKLYDLEKEKRWNMAENKEQAAIEKIIYIIAGICDIPQEKIKYDRLDKICFKKYPVQDNDWVKGSPDYIVILFLEKSQYLFIECYLNFKTELFLDNLNFKTELFLIFD